MNFDFDLDSNENEQNIIKQIKLFENIVKMGEILVLNLITIY